MHLNIFYGAQKKCRTNNKTWEKWLKTGVTSRRNQTPKPAPQQPMENDLNSMQNVKKILLTTNNEETKVNEATETKNAQIIKRLVGGSFGKRIEEEIKQEAHDERLALLDKITPLQAQRKAQHDIYLKEVAVSLPRLDLAKAELKAAEEAHYKVVTDEQRSKSSFSAQSHHIQARIAATAPIAIHEFIKEMKEIDTETMNTNLTEKSQSTGNFYPATGKDEHAVYSLLPSINRRLKAIRNARDQAKLLKEEVLPPGELHDKLAALRDSIPAIKADHVYNRPDH